MFRQCSQCKTSFLFFLSRQLWVFNHTQASKNKKMSAAGCFHFESEHVKFVKTSYKRDLFVEKGMQFLLRPVKTPVQKWVLCCIAFTRIFLFFLSSLEGQPTGIAAQNMKPLGLLSAGHYVAKLTVGFLYEFTFLWINTIYAWECVYTCIFLTECIFGKRIICLQRCVSI